MSGRLAIIRMDEADGRRPGDITSLPSGHDVSVVGEEAAAVVDWYSASNYAKAAEFGGGVSAHATVPLLCAQKQ